MNIAIGIPTIKSATYIVDSLERILNEVSLCPSNWSFQLLVCINGLDAENIAEQKIKLFLSSHSEINWCVLIEKKAGKNNAMNAIVSYARSLNGIDIVHFFDDDVYLEEGTLSVNLETLIRHELKFHKAVLVGSAFVTIRHPLRFFLDGYTLVEAIGKWIFHLIITQPYLLDSERPKFCEGPSFCCYLKYVPILPDDKNGITDDSFLSNFFAVQGKDDFLKNGIPFIAKPKNSISYIKVPIDIFEWKRQQIRIHAGIERSFAYFSSERNYLEEYFSWGYAFNIESRTRFSEHSFFKKVLHFLYMKLNDGNRKEAQRFIIKNKVPNWSIARSTKA